VFAGYLAALIAKQKELASGALSAWLWITVGMLSLFSRKLFLGIWLDLLSLLLSPVLGLIGGYLRRAQIRAAEG
jgi:hypothetical protein